MGEKGKREKEAGVERDAEPKRPSARGGGGRAGVGEAEVRRAAGGGAPRLRGDGCAPASPLQESFFWPRTQALLGVSVEPNGPPNFVLLDLAPSPSLPRKLIRTRCPCNGFGQDLDVETSPPFAGALNIMSPTRTNFRSLKSRTENAPKLTLGISGTWGKIPKSQMEWGSSKTRVHPSCSPPGS